MLLQRKKSKNKKKMKKMKLGSSSPLTKGKIMTAFLPENYEAPSASGNYMKLQQGENKFRILSAPILGWEDWTLEKKPVRFTYDQKPVKSIDPARPVKHFWAMIVWNYKEERIQILHLTQASIRNAIQALSENEDWGAPYFYDLKVIKKGEKVDTEYNVAPSPHKPVSETIKKAFRDKPCNLEALFENLDPFASNPAHGFTCGIFDDAAPSIALVNAVKEDEPTLTEEQQQEIMTLVGNDDAYQQRILDGYKVLQLSDIKQKYFSAIIGKLKKRAA